MMPHVLPVFCSFPFSFFSSCIDICVCFQLVTGWQVQDGSWVTFPSEAPHACHAGSSQGARLGHSLL